MLINTLSEENINKNLLQYRIILMKQKNSHIPFTPVLNMTVVS